MDNKTKILKNAVKLFSEKGYDAVGVQELVDANKITKPTLYYHFGSKEGLLKEIYKSYFTTFNDGLKINTKYVANPKSYFDDVFPVLMKIVEYYFIFSKQNKNFYRMSLWLQYMAPDSLAYKNSKGFTCIQYELIEKMFHEISIVHGNMKTHEKQYAWTFIGMINTYISLSYSQELTLTSDLAEKAVKQFMHGIFS